MPRDKNTEAFEISAEDLPDLTEKQQKFVSGILQGRTASDAYRAAYDASGMKDSTIWVRASELRANSNVKVWLKAARIAGLQQFSEDYATAKRQHLERLEELAEKAEASGNYGAAHQCVKAQGQVLGLYIERHEETVRTPATIDLLSRIETELGPAARRAAATRLGLEESSPRPKNDDDLDAQPAVTH